uniref:Uncharacterized protein n=1 Tax=Nelumbo nucifera TaxID=4432 RepID=A0A822ZV88_NELNU|nr:TPA_asm: hypothetical protein HUJ06_016723 [Nelumbo nucifera]
MSKLPLDIGHREFEKPKSLDGGKASIHHQPDVICRTEEYLHQWLQPSPPKKLFISNPVISPKPYNIGVLNTVHLLTEKQSDGRPEPVWAEAKMAMGESIHSAKRLDYLVHLTSPLADSEFEGKIKGGISEDLNLAPGTKSRFLHRRLLPLEIRSYVAAAAVQNQGFAPSSLKAVAEAPTLTSSSSSSSSSLLKH